MVKLRIVVLFLLVIILLACTRQEQWPDQLFRLLPPEETGVDFQNEVHENPGRHLGMYDYFYNGGGVATGDINNDGLPDLFFTGNDVPNRLYLNKGNFRFEDISREAGIQTASWSTGVTMVDINDDGWLDIYVCNSGPYTDSKKICNHLFINNGLSISSKVQGVTFSEQAEAFGIAGISNSTQAVFFDMEGDTDLDLFVINHAFRNDYRYLWDWVNKHAQVNPEKLRTICNALYRNEGNGKFTDVSLEAGIFKPGFGLGVAVSDLDQNGYLDLYVTNDFFVPDFLFLNNGNGTFNDKISGKFSHISYYSMGCDAADLNNDGLVDLAVVDMTPRDHYLNKTLMSSMDVSKFQALINEFKYVHQYMFNSLQINLGFGIFSDIGLYSGTAQTDWSWAVLLADFDNDGLKDIFISNGFFARH